MSEQTEANEVDEQAGDNAATENPGLIKLWRIIPRRRVVATTDASDKGTQAESNGAELTGDPKGAHTSGQGKAAATSTKEGDMARKPDAPEAPPSFYKLIDDDPTVPKAGAVIGRPEEPVESKPMADLSKPEDFPEEVRAVIESAPK
jgi:hypothetical protein